MKKLLYLETRDACCESGEYKSHENLLKAGAIVGVAYLVDEITGKEWGDDWNDAPSCCNSGSPYPERCTGLEIRELKLGESL